MTKKITTTLLIGFIVVIAVAAGTYFWPTGPEPKKEVTSPEEVVEDFIGYTLAYLGNSDFDYPTARTLLTTSLNDQFTDDDLFVPMFYGIQDGPDSVEFMMKSISGNDATVRYDATWGEMTMPWSFILVKENDHWLINQFRTDAQ